MKKEELAEIMNGREYRSEISKKEEHLAKENGLIVIFGASDDLVEFRGAIYDEISAWGGVDFIIATDGTMVLIDEEEETYRKAKGLEVFEIENGYQSYYKNKFTALWNPDELDCSWLIKTDLPHSTFDIFEDGDLYCRGIIVEVSALT